ncbi:MAG: methylated-DNA--[protein]-cysteine S-methyltransferase [Candidatus Eisenbacteria bacterium]|nr:methylated-DNA--[protein]-cysteine S-methyltransferase [Candidatus Eisenbacteria bacterium]
MISVWIEPFGETWYAVAHHGRRLVATATGLDASRAERSLRLSLPGGAPCERTMEGSEYWEYARGVTRMLARLEAGDVEFAAFELCPDCVHEPVASVARVASAIPRGFVATYGGIAVAAGTEARVVGRIMATNPLYPIIPCHRVVGADLALVGYNGRQDRPALRAKLERLRAEAKGFTKHRTIPALIGGADLDLYPVEAVLEKASREDPRDGGQQSLW